MNKLAIFVEGYTEVVFVEKLIEEIAGKNNVRIENRTIRGGTSTRRKSAIVKAARRNTGQKYYVLVFDCGGDELVKPRIVEEYDNLAKSGYKKIIGIRDVRPKYTRAQIRTLEAMLPKYVKTKPIQVEFVLAVMEIEAWFLAEASHYPKIDPTITVPAIIAALHFDPENDDMQQRLAPAEDLNNCYMIGGKTYQKHSAKATVNVLDFALIYMELWKKFKYLECLITSLGAFLS